MSLSLITVIVLMANGVMAVTAALLLMLVTWQAPRQRANQMFAVVMVAMIAYAITNGLGRFIDRLNFNAMHNVYVALTLYGLFTVAMFFFATEYAQITGWPVRILRVAGIGIFVAQTYALWDERLLINIRPAPSANGSYQGDWMFWGYMTAGSMMIYHLLAAIILRFSRSPRARALWPAPALVVLAAISAVYVWPRVPVPLNAVLLALSAVALGRPVLLHELFSPLAEAHADLARQDLELRRASAMKTQFLTNMSYELRTPLNSIIGYTELVLHGTYGTLNDTQRDRLQKVVRNGHHLLGLVNDVLDLNKIGAGGISLQLRPVVMPELLDSVLATVEPQAQAKGLTIARIYSAVPPVLADEIRLRQIITNIVSNAVKFTHEGGVTVSARANGDSVEVAIADTGIGIPADQAERVFTEFEQLDGSSTRRYEGTGLGLAITRRLVELHGGRIWFNSVNGQGTTFYVVLPTITHARTPAPPA